MSPCSPTPLPPDVIALVARCLHDDLDGSHLGTIASLRLLSTGAYETVTPILFSTLIIDGDSPALDLGSSEDIPARAQVRDREDEHDTNGAPPSPAKGTISARPIDYFQASGRSTRRRDNLRHVRRLIVHTTPPRHILCSSTSTDLEPKSTSSACAPHASGHLIFPNLTDITLHPLPTDSLRTHSPLTDTPPLLAWLARTSRPSRFTLIFPLVPSYQWAEYRDASTAGSYALVSRLNRLVNADADAEVDGPWAGCMRELVIRDAVHQVLPSLRGVRNVYHFADHIAEPRSDTTARPTAYHGRAPIQLTTSTSGPISGHIHKYSCSGIGRVDCVEPQPSIGAVSLPPGPDSTSEPGPEWNLRAWQLSTAIKNLFPSSSSSSSSMISASAATPSPATSAAAETVRTTSWIFINVAGHVLTKDDRDDDDESGVEYTQVRALVEDLVGNGLKLDLPARQGFGEEELEMLFKRILYRDDWDHPEAGGWDRHGLEGTREFA